MYYGREEAKWESVERDERGKGEIKPRNELSSNMGMGMGMGVGDHSLFFSVTHSGSAGGEKIWERENLLCEDNTLIESRVPLTRIRQLTHAHLGTARRSSYC